MLFSQPIRQPQSIVHTDVLTLPTKREQGKSHYNELEHVANKVIRILYKVMTENIPFNLS